MQLHSPTMFSISLVYSTSVIFYRVQSHCLHVPHLPLRLVTPPLWPAYSGSGWSLDAGSGVWHTCLHPICPTCPPMDLGHARRTYSYRHSWPACHDDAIQSQCCLVSSTAITANAQGLGAGIGFLLITFLTEQYGIRTMLYVQAEVAFFVAILATIYFPSSPPTPPSLSAMEGRTNFLDSMKKLMLNRNFIFLAVSGGAISGAVL